jgi:carboxyl-terminal processing protease
MTGIRPARVPALVILAGLVLQLGTLHGQSAGQSAPPAAPSPAPPEAAVDAFRRLLATRYVTPVDPEGLAKARSMEDLLQLVRTDPFTDVYSPSQWQQLTVSLGESFGGIGAVLGSIRDTVVIGDLLPDGPAAAAGLHARDRVLAIDDSSVSGWTVPHAVSRIRGRIGTKVTLSIVRGNGPAQPISLIRASVQTPSLPAASLAPNGIGVITLSQFGPGISADLASTIERMRAHGLTSLILDLRGNPGGLLDEAIAVANLFLPKGSLIVETRYRGQDPDRHFADRSPPFPTMPLALLVGPESASASEILAGALQDAHRAVVIGRQTYGKGLVQSTSQLADGWMAKFTVGRWYTPAGRLIDRGMHASADSTKPFDPMAPHSGGIQPEIVIQDSVQDAASQAYDLMEKAGTPIFLALDDEVGRFLAEHPDLSPGADPVAGSAAQVFAGAGAAADSLGAEAKATLTPWLDGQVTKRAIEARFGYGSSLIWQNSRDPQVAAAARALISPNTEWTTTQRN